MIIHIPHASRRLDEHVKLVREKENLDFLTDDYVDEIFRGSLNPVIHFGWSRFVCDVERLREKDPMEAKGQGVIYKHDVFGNNITRNISDEDAYKLYDEHHRALTKAVNFTTAYFDNAIIVEAHSYEPTNENDPDICLGTDDFHTPQEVITILYEHFSGYGYTVGINHPFSGTIVPKIHYQKSRNVLSIMIELNKKTCRKDMEKIKIAIKGVFDILDLYE